jgi:hypothetical protein
MGSHAGIVLLTVIAGCNRDGGQRASVDTAAPPSIASDSSQSYRALHAKALSTFHCVPESTFRLGAVQVGDSGSKALAALGPPLSQEDGIEHGMDFEFAVTHYRYRDLEITVTHSTERVAEIQPLTASIRTPLGLHLGMSRTEAERVFPQGALGVPLAGDPPPENALEAYSCGDKASTVLLMFDASGNVSRLFLNGFYGVP